MMFRSARHRPAPARSVLSAVTVTVVCVMPVFLVGGLAVQLTDELGFSPAGLGLAVSAYFGVSALSSLPAGVLVERYGPVVTARAGVALAAACLAAIALAARSFPVLVALLAASAAGNALGQLSSNAALSRVPAHRQGLSFGIKQAAVPGATLLAGAAVPAVALTVGWRWAFLAAAGLALVTLPLTSSFGPADHRGARPAGRGGRATGALATVGAAVAMGAAAAGSLGTFLVDAAATRGLAPGTAGLLLTAGSVLCLAGRVGGGWLADRRGVHDITPVAGLLAVGAVAMVLLALPSTVALVAGVLLGFGLGWAWPGLVNVAVVRLHPDSPAAATSITQTGVYLGGCLGPLGFGTVAAHAGYQAAWLAAGGALVVGTALMLVGRHRLRHRRAGGHPRTG